MPNPPLTGPLNELLGGRYRLIEQIGHGSMGTVHRAQDEFLGREVAVKIIATQAVDAADLRRDDDEVKMLARLNHHSLVTLLDAGSVTGLLGARIYLVMELIQGPDLRQHLTHGPMPARHVGQIGYDLADALDYVHANGVIHRDIKPANIVMFDYPNDAARVRAKLTDFGVAVMMEAPWAHGGIFIGTAAYVSPEQAKSEKLAPTSDVYSLGLVLLECLTGIRSYPGQPLESALARLIRAPEIPSEIGPTWTGLLTAMTATEPTHRPSAREVALALEENTLAAGGRRRGDTPPGAADEVARMDAVHRYQILDTPPDGAFDTITALAARLFAVPMALVSVVDHDRIWFKSRHGLQIDQIDRDPGLCASAILHDEPWIIQNARTDPRCLANPLVAGEFGLQFYAGVPLRTRDGHNLGTLCVMDREPRTFGPEDRKTLQDLAAIVMNDLELRLEARQNQ